MSVTTEVWLYGSAARGDNDADSDIDVLVAGELDEGSLAQVPYPRPSLSVVRYAWEELDFMASYGSLFLHHVRLEGMPVYARSDSRLAAILEGLPPYGRAAQELASFVAVLDDVERSLDDDPAAPFELSVIATALRHSCILGCYGIGQPTFGRRSAFEVFLSYAGFEGLIGAVQQLYEFRLFEDQRGPAPFPASNDDVRVWLGRARDIITAVEATLSGRD